MSMDPMGGRPEFGAGEAQNVPADGGGACGTCGRPLPPPDLEGVAAGIDHTLSLEAGKMVPRTAWAGRAPDGVMDSLLSFMPAVRSRKQLWERGQALWTERMTFALSGPCDTCRGEPSAQPLNAGQPPAGPTMAQPYADQSPAQAPTGYMPAVDPSAPPPDEAQPPYAGATAVVPAQGFESAEQYEEPAAQHVSDAGMPSAIPAQTDRDGPSPGKNQPGLEQMDDESATSAIPAFMAHATEPPPAPAAPPAPAPYDDDEHESHTVMISLPTNVRAGPRLIVVEGPVHGRQFALGRQQTTIGRSIGCHVTVDAESVGYDHARVLRGDDGWSIEPIGGCETHVNDDLVREPRQLRNGDVLRIGPARIRFESVG